MTKATTIALMATLVATTSAARAADGPTSRPATARPAASRPVATRPAPRAADPLVAAVGALVREANAALRADKPFPRAEPDFFQSHPAPAPAAVVEALGRELNPDPRIDAYVKLQLLSVAEKFDGPLAAPATKSYVLGAPPPVPAPSIDPHAWARWNARLELIHDADAVAKANDEYAAAREPVDKANVTILAYRDAMRARIKPADSPGQGRLLAAELEDLSARAAAGVPDVGAALGKLAGEIEKWAAAANADEVDTMDRMLDEQLARRSNNVSLKKVTLTQRTNVAHWTSDPTTLDHKRLTELKTKLLAVRRHAE